MLEKKLEEWLNIPLTLETSFRNVEGMLKYGVRLPIHPGTTPLVECNPNSREDVEGESPAYWFVNKDQTIKIKLISAEINGERVFGVAKDSETFTYTIRR